MYIKQYGIIILLFVFFLTSCGTRRSMVLGSKTNTGNIGSNKSTNSAPIPASANEYIDRYKNIAIAEMNKYGIPASIKLGQAILESGMGKSALALEANNHFGIKCGGVWSGKTTVRADDRPDDCFRVYNNPEDSFKDHSQFLLRKRYEKLFSLPKNDYKGWANGLKQAGYATNPRYPELLINIIERYNLARFDRQETLVERDSRSQHVEEIIEEQKSDIQSAPSEKVKAPVAMIIHEVKTQETLYSLSKTYGVTVEQIKQWNNLTTDNLSIGQLLVVTK